MSTKSAGPDHYRYSSQRYLGNLQVSCERFICIAETPKCYYVISDMYAEHLDRDNEYSKNLVNKRKRLVLKDSRIRYCYPTKQQALNSFLVRQRKRAEYAKRDLQMANLAVSVMDTDQHRADPPNEINCGRIASASLLDCFVSEGY